MTSAQMLSFEICEIFEETFFEELLRTTSSGFYDWERGGGVKHQPNKMVKHTQTIHRLLRTNCLSVFDHFAGLALKGLIKKQLCLGTKCTLL